MKGISTHVGAWRRRVTFYDLHVANGTQVLHIVFILLFENHAFLPNFFLNEPQKIRNSVRVNSSIRDDVSELLVTVPALKEQRIILRNVKNLSQNVQCVNAMIETLIWAGALDLIPNRNLEFNSSKVLKDEAGSARDPNKVEFFHFVQQVFG